MPGTSDRPPRDARSPAAPSWAERLAALEADIARRLRPVCAATPQAEFDALVRLMAERQLKYQLRDSL